MSCIGNIPDKIDWIRDGERANATTFNRPLKQLLAELEKCCPDGGGGGGVTTPNVYLFDQTMKGNIQTGDFVYIDQANKKLEKALADGSVKENVIGICKIHDDKDGKIEVISQGAVDITGRTLETGKLYYLHSTTPGSYSTVKTNTLVGVGINENTLFVKIASASGGTTVVPGTGVEIDDNSIVTDKTWSSDKINKSLEKKAEIDDANTLTTKTWSSEKISQEIQKHIGQGGGGTTQCNCIDDSAPKADKTYSSNKIEELLKNIKPGTGGSVELTKEMIIEKLGYTPANEKVTDNHEKRITLLENNTGTRPGGGGSSSSGSVSSTGKYRIVNIDTDYTLTANDLAGNTIIRGTKQGNQNITVPIPSGSVIEETDNSSINQGSFGGAGLLSLYALVVSKYTKLSVAKYKQENPNVEYGTKVTPTFEQWDTWFPTWKQDGANIIKTQGENKLNQDRDYAVSIGQWIPGVSDPFYWEAMTIVKDKNVTEIETWLTESVTQKKFAPAEFTYKPSTTSVSVTSGSVVTIRKVDDTENSVLTLLPGDGVTFNPADSTILRRSGSSAVLVYIGDGVFDIFNELP